MSLLQEVYKTEPATETVQIAFNGQDFPVVIRKEISLEDYLSAARRCAELCFVFEDGRPVGYVPANKVFAMNYVLLRYWTDIDFSDMSGEDENNTDIVEAIWRLCLGTDLLSHVEDTVGYSLLVDLEHARDDIIEEIKRDLRPGADVFWTSLNELLDSIKQQFGEMSDEDMEATREAIRKLGGLDNGKIVDLMKTK